MPVSQFYIERMQPDWLPERQRWWYRAGAGVLLVLPVALIAALAIAFAYGLANDLSEALPAGLLSGLVCGILGGLVFGLVRGALRGILIGLVAGLAVGLVFIPAGPSFALSLAVAVGVPITLIVSIVLWRPNRFVGDFDVITPFELLRWSWRKAAEGWVMALPLVVISVLAGLLAGKVLDATTLGGQPPRPASLSINLPFGELLNIPGLTASTATLVGFLLLAGIMLQLMFTIFRGLSADEIGTRTVPNQGIRHSLRNAIIVGIMSLVVGGLLGFVEMRGHAGRSTWIAVGGLADGIGVGICIGLIGAILSGWIACVQHAVLRVLIHRQGALPWDLAHFLDDAAQHILLHRVGGGYIFVHRLMQDYFAERYAEYWPDEQ